MCYIAHCALKVNVKSYSSYGINSQWGGSSLGLALASTDGSISPISPPSRAPIFFPGFFDGSVRFFVMDMLASRGGRC